MQIIQEIYNGRFASNKGKGPVFATTWINLMDAWAMEDANPTTDKADWPTIGYSAPGVGSSNNYSSSVIDYTGNDKTWQAAAKVDLNDCPKTSGMWKMQATVNGTSVYYSDNTSTPECKNLTPAWTGLYRSSN